MQGFDYATPAAYFVTICTYERRLLFEDAVLAEIVEQQWHALPQRFPTVDLDVFVVMPNHIHGILMLNTADVGAPLAGAQTLRTPTRATSSDATEGQRAGPSPAPTPGDAGAPLAGAQMPRMLTGATSSGTTDRPRAGASPASTLGTVVGAYKFVGSDRVASVGKGEQCEPISPRVAARLLRTSDSQRR